ncbi:WD40 repeat domain-containing protein [Anditalea andensis]|uniref:Uncharacterized protein n=1 Tax=Anditalea andensis TaxID=1048983 RepID=A0A074LLS9_9BACT|nr:WD-40 repeat protein [Anditalea andensis]KEO74827.1 hypothetical protein EL17_03875 [Anditalea andensis]
MPNIQVNKLHTLTGHNDAIYALAEYKGTGFFYTGAADGMVVEWNLDQPQDGRLIARLNHSVYALYVDSARGWLFIGHNNEGIHVIDLTTKKEIWNIKITSEAIFDIKEWGGFLYAGTGDGVVVVVDIAERSIVKHLKLSEKSVRVMALHPFKDEMAIGLSDHSIKVFSLNDFLPIANLNGHTNSVFALDFAPDGVHLVSGGRDAQLKIWDTNGYSFKENIAAHLFAVNYISFKKDGKFFVTCSMDKSIKLWDAETFRLQKVIDKGRHAGHGTSVNKLVWSDHSDKVIAVSDDRTISIWDFDIKDIIGL